MATEKVIRIKIDSTKARRNVRNLDRDMERLGESADKTTSSFGKLKSVAQAVAGALAVQQITKYADAFTSIQNQIRQTTRNTEELTTRTNQLLAVANRSRSEFATTAELYTTLNLSTQELKLSSDELLRITETIGKSFAVSGKSAEEASGAIRQLSQGLASGALRGDEFNSVAEGAPEIMRAIQRETGKTQGELREFAATGEITSELLIRSLTKASTVIDDKMNRSVKTLSQNLQEAENNLTRFIGESETVQSTIGAAGDVIVSLSDNLDIIANTVLIAAIAGFGKLSAGLIINTTETIKNTAVKIANAQATSGVSAALGVQAQRMTVATAAMRTATAAGTALRGVLAFLGGPVGVAITAASAIALFGSNAEDAKTPTQELAERVDDLTSKFSQLNKIERELRIKEINTQIRGLNNELSETQQALEAALNSSKAREGLTGNITNVGKLQRRVNELKTSLRELSAEQEALFTVGLNQALEGATDATITDGPRKRDKDDSFVNTERFRTESLRNELNERRALNQAYNESIVSQTATRLEQERAIIEFNRQAELARLERQKADAALRFEEEREALLTNEKLKAEQRLILLAELEQQELLQKQIFEEEKTAIEQAAAEDRIRIAQQEAIQKINTIQGFANTALSINEAFGSKSEKNQKKRRKRQVVIDAAAGIGRAFAEHNFYVALGISAAIAANAKKQLSAIDSASSVQGGGQSSSAGRVQQDQPQRQEVPAQTNVVEIRGLAEVAQALRDRDPDEVLPVEYTQRIVNSLDTFNRLSGQTNE